MRRVVKLGGSLLKFPDLRDRVARWQHNHSAAETLVVVGGGAAIDAMRDLDARFSLGQAEMHWRCVRLLRATFEVACEIFPHWNRIATSEQLEQVLSGTSANGGTYLVAVDCFYFPGSRLSEVLPPSWDTTSDSIAAGLARVAAASELHLLKSCPIPRGRSLEELSQLGIVDRALPEVTGGTLPISLYCLGDD